MMRQDAPPSSSKKTLVLLAFLAVHGGILALGIINLMHPISLRWFFVASLLAVVTRILNGRLVFGKNHASHYLIWIAIFFLAAMTQNIKI